ncbi:hypothetical protein [Plantibacter sp. M259]|uniref:hypothetical protein n=1 Tax=Plantibacter sp. M259 TaxID=2583822 RepID=UPI00143D75B7|nr:hypothetical protein [Plantibacter sp. M259]
MLADEVVERAAGDGELEHARIERCVFEELGDEASVGFAGALGAAQRLAGGRTETPEAARPANCTRR